MADLEDGEILDSDEETPVSTSEDRKTDTVKQQDGALAPSSSFSSIQAQPTYANQPYRTSHNHRNTNKGVDTSDSSDEDTDLWQCKKAKYFSKPRTQSMDISHVITSPPRGCKQPQSNETDEDIMESPQKKRKVNDIWGSVLTEQTLTHSLKNSISVDKNEDNTDERDVESYDFTKAYNDDRPSLVEERSLDPRETNDPFENVLNTIEELYDGDKKEGNTRKRKRAVKDRLGGKDHYSVKDRPGEKDRYSVKERLGEKDYYGVKDRLGERDNYGRKDRLGDEAGTKVTEEDPDEKVLKAILDMLNEPNGDLFGKIISVIGKAKALKIAHLTEDVESAGGMLTFDGARRRTPGGVFIQLLKKSRDITAEQTKEIFAEEEMKYKQQVRQKKKARRKKFRKLRMMLPQSKYTSNNSREKKQSQEKVMDLGNENVPEVEESDDSGDDFEHKDIALEIEEARQTQIESRKMDDSCELSLHESDVIDIEIGECESIE